MKSFLAIGELLWDLLPDGRQLGGAPANFAFRLKELGNEVILVSKLGADELGDQARMLLENNGLPSEFIQTDLHHPTGTVNVFFDEDKNPSYHINTGAAYDFIECTEPLTEAVKKTDCIAYGTLAQRSTITKNTINDLIRLGTNAIKFYDINLRKDCFTKESIESSLTHADIAKLNHHELAALAEMFSFSNGSIVEIGKQLVRQFNLTLCLVTFEAAGALAIADDGKVVYSPGYHIELEDALGAGDAFSAAFLHAYFQGKSIAESLEASNVHGAMAAMQKGAMQPMDLNLLNTIKAKTFKRVEHPDLIFYKVDEKDMYMASHFKKS